MSMLPLLEDAFGHGLHPEEFIDLLGQPNGLMNSNVWPGIYQRHFSIPNRNQRSAQAATNLTKPNVGKDGFQVCIDVQHFQPNEIVVKTIDTAIVVEGKHEEKEDEHGHVYRHFLRRYKLPIEFDLKDVVSTLSSDGVLTIRAPPKSQAIESNERVIQIQQTGPARLSVKINEKVENGEQNNGVL